VDAHAARAGRRHLSTRFPENTEQDFIKRVIALPGDTLEAKNGHPWLNGWEVPHCYVGVYEYIESNTEMETPAAPQKHEGDLYVEYLGERTYLTLYDHATLGYSTIRARSR